MKILSCIWRRRYPKLLLMMFATVLIVSCTASITSSAQNQVEQARSADAFVDSIGFNVHLTYTDTAYGKYKTIIRPRLQELGIRHIRDGFVRKTPHYNDKLRDLATIGIHATLIAGIGWVTPQQAVAIAQQLDDAIEAVEGPNEYDLGKNRQEWVPELRQYTEQLHDAFKNSRPTAHLPLIGPSFVHGDSSRAIGTLAQWVDYGNMHPYNYPDQPGDRNIDRELKNRAQPFKTKPLVVTETGYHTANIKSDRPLTEKAQAKYLPRLFLEYFNRDISRTFSYELIDQRVKPQDKEANFGVLRNDGSPKPAFIALKNLIELLKDPGDRFSLKLLNYTLSGNTFNVHHTLLQKRNGSFYLILWQEVPSFDRKTHRDLTVAAQPVTLTLATPAKQATIYQISQSTTPVVQKTNPKKLDLNISDSPLVVELLVNQNS